MTDDLVRHVAGLLEKDYLIEAEIGRGGMAVVYRAIERHQSRRVAIKVLPPQRAFTKLRQSTVKSTRAWAVKEAPRRLWEFHSIPRARALSAR